MVMSQTGWAAATTIWYEDLGHYGFRFESNDTRGVYVYVMACGN